MAVAPISSNEMPRSAVVRRVERVGKARWFLALAMPAGPATFGWLWSLPLEQRPTDAIVVGSLVATLIFSASILAVAFLLEAEAEMIGGHLYGPIPWISMFRRGTVGRVEPSMVRRAEGGRTLYRGDQRTRFVRLIYRVRGWGPSEKVLFVRGYQRAHFDAVIQWLAAAEIPLHELPDDSI